MLKNKLVVFFGSIMALTILVSANNSNKIDAQKQSINNFNSNINSNRNDYVYWQNNGTIPEECSWSGQFRFGLVGHGSPVECAAVFPPNVWDIIKGNTFYIDITSQVPDEINLRVTTGWWSTSWGGPEFNHKDELIQIDDHTFTLEITFNNDPIVGELDEKDLLFTGSRYIVERLYSRVAPTPQEYSIANNNKSDDKEQNHGYLDINKTTSAAGGVCTITVNPLRGYALKEGSLKVTHVDDPSQTYEVTLPDPDIEWVYTFVMPENDVIVSAEFIESAVPVPPSSGSNLSGGAIAGIVVGSLIGVGLIALLIVILLKKKKKEVTE